MEISSRKGKESQNLSDSDNNRKIKADYAGKFCFAAVNFTIRLFPRHSRNVLRKNPRSFRDLHIFTKAKRLWNVNENADFTDVNAKETDDFLYVKVS